MAIRQQKVKEWQQASWWVERGLALYGEHAARPESVDDLRKRLTAYQAKLSAPTTRARKAQPKPHAAPVVQTIEALICENCGGSFDRVITRGRKPKNCPAAAAPPARQVLCRADRPRSTPRSLPHGESARWE